MSEPREELPPVQQYISEQIFRAAVGLPDSYWFETVAMTICATGEIRRALAALSLVRELAVAHTGQSWGAGSQTAPCPRCHVGHPCDESLQIARVLETPDPTREDT